ncbi:MAG: MBL fold metallo-hydrolase [Candidatus Pacebacteria bacterium]|nr:MBL fold metallo-hydrolase [Candidatus Paceibacterota bacterium]
MTIDLSKKPSVTSFFDPATYTISHVVFDPATKEAAVIDSVMDYDPASGRTYYKHADEIIKYVRENNLTVAWHLETHMHADHLSAAPYLQQHLGGKLGIGEKVIEVQKTFGKVFNAGTEFARDGSQFDRLWKDGDTFMLGSIPVSVLYTPGHTPADVSYCIGDAAFVGDTLFMPDFGSARCDFPGGDAGTLYESVQKLYALPDEMRMFMCHDYLPEGRTQYVWETTVGQEKRENIHLNTSVGQESFIAMRVARDQTLAMPRLIIPSIQVNMRAGALPPAEDNGTSYLRIPVNGAFAKVPKVTD